MLAIVGYRISVFSTGNARRHGRWPVVGGREAYAHSVGKARFGNATRRLAAARIAGRRLFACSHQQPTDYWYPRYTGKQLVTFDSRCGRQGP